MVGLALTNERPHFKIREFVVDGHNIRFYCKKKQSDNGNPPWLDFVNTQIDDHEEKIDFPSSSTRVSGLLLIEVQNRILAATFGLSGRSMLKDFQLVSDFGIKTAMNICGNERIRQTKSSTHSTVIQNINRQLSIPSDSFTFGFSDAEFLDYISAHIPESSNITLQGKDNLTIKAIGDEKLNWPSLIRWSNIFINKYKEDAFKEAFPNYLNLQNASPDEASALNIQLVELLKAKDYEKIHLAIPEFISDSEYSFSYSRRMGRKNNDIVSYLDIQQLDATIPANTIELKKLESRYIYAYSPEFNTILGDKKWSIYRCLIAEIQKDGFYYILSHGEWKKLDSDFYHDITVFINDKISQDNIPEEFKNINILVDRDGKVENREDAFNTKYCEVNDNAILFDKAKLKIGNDPKNKEFCDIFEYDNSSSVSIIHVKKHQTGSSLNHLFNQARFYCESFISDKNLLVDVIDHIKKSEKPVKENFLEYVENDIRDVVGKDYSVKLWLLYDNKKEEPRIDKLPIMAKYDLKITYEKLINVCKFSTVTLSMIPVEMAKITKRQ